MLPPSARRHWRGPNQAPLPLRVVAWGIAGAAQLLASEARAAAPARLEWVRLEGAGSCVDRTELEARVRRRLGTEPFDPRASRSIEGVVQRTGKVWRAQIVVRSRPEEPSPPRRELESTAENCESLSSAVVLAVALAIDPAAAFRDASVEAPPPPALPARAPEPPPTSPPSAASVATLAGRAELRLEGQLGLLPHVSGGVGLGVATVLTKNFELGLRARAFPEVQVSGDPSYALGLVALTPELCRVTRPGKWLDLRTCAGPSLGLLHASVLQGDRTQPGQRTSLTAELGLDATLALTSKLALELGARAALPVTRYRFLLEGSDQPLFTQSAVAALVHLGLELRFGAPP